MSPLFLNVLTNYVTKAQTKHGIIGYIEGFYNNSLPPFCFELSKTKRSPLQLQTSTPGSMIKTIKTTGQNLHSNPLVHVDDVAQAIGTMFADLN